MSKHFDGYDPERFRSAATYNPHQATTSRHFIPGQRVAPDSLLTVIGPGFKDRYGKVTYRDVKVYCDPQYGGCGRTMKFAYALLFGYKGKYSCGCKHRRGANEGDHAGFTATGYYTGRTLSILYFDESVNLWAYVCECCGEIGHIPRGLGQTTPMKLKAEARKPCRNAPVFIWLEDTGVKRSTLFRPKEVNDKELESDLRAKFAGCTIVYNVDRRPVGIQAINSTVDSTIKRSDLPKGVKVGTGTWTS